MNLKPLASLSRAEIRDLVRIHAKLFAFLRASKTLPEEAAHDFAARNWQQFREVSLDYLAVKLALAERDALESN